MGQRSNTFPGGLTPEQWRSVDNLFERVLDAAPARRPALIDALSGDDEILRCALLAALAASERPEPGLEPGALAVSGDPFADLERDALAAGDRVGAWCIVREIGRGGVGTVYLAERGDGQYVQRAALKVLRRGLDTDDVLARFRLERQLLASLSHPNIATLLDGGATADGRPFLVMEWVEGRPITEFCDHHGLSLRQRVMLFVTVAEAVEYAHRKLVIHRDLKPGNILVSAGGASDAGQVPPSTCCVKLIDFGIAKLLRAAAVPGDTPPTRAGTRLLTPDYATPEQVRGEPVSTATDIYQLGIVLYELLTGCHPQPVGDSASIERIVCEREPVPPSRANIAAPRAESIHGLRRALHGDLDGIVQKALRKHPDDRYASVTALADDIRRWLDGRPVRARPTGWIQRCAKLLYRRPLAAGAVFAGLLAAVAFTLTLWFYARMLETERDSARLQAARADQVSEFLIQLFEAPELEAGRGGETPVRVFLDRGSARLSEQSALAADAVTRAATLHVLGTVYASLGMADEALALLRESLRLRESSPHAGTAQQAATLHALGRLLQEQSRHAEAEPYLAAAITRLDAERSPDRLLLARSLFLLARSVRRDSARLAEAEALVRRGVVLQADILGSDHPEHASALAMLAYVSGNGSDRAAAIDAYGRAIERLRDDPDQAPDQVIERSVMLHNLAYLHWRTGQYAQAEPLYLEALQALQALDGPAHPRTMRTLQSLADLYRDTGRLEQAEALLVEAVTLLAASAGERHERTLQARRRLEDLRQHAAAHQNRGTADSGG